MKVPIHSNIKYWFSNIATYWKKGYPSQIGKLINDIMTGRKLEDDTEETPNKKLCTEVEKKIDVSRVKKRHVALLLSYSGANYHGMQINCGFKTVEGELLQALYNCNVIPDKALLSPQVINFQRAARTDKNVSAARQVVSFFIAENFCIDDINRHLPEDVRVFSIKRVTKGFSSWNFCSARTYSYTLPTFALAPNFFEEYPENFRIDQKTIKKVSEILQSYVGSNLYHNFTSRKDYKDPSARRYIISFTPATPFIENGEEFITLTIKGQSFMLHQIRKMVGHLIALLKGKVSEDIKVNIWKEEKYVVPLAPGLGLVLEDIHYDMYNKKYGTDGIHEALLWDDIADSLNDFKKKYIFSHIINKEIEEKLMFNWTLKLRDHSYIVEECNEDLLELESKN